MKAVLASLGFLLFALPAAMSQSLEADVCAGVRPVIDDATSRFKNYRQVYDADLEEYTATSAFPSATSCMVYTDFSYYRCDWSFPAERLSDAEVLFSDFKRQLAACFPSTKVRDQLIPKFEAELKTFEDRRDNVEVSTQRRAFVSRRSGIKTIFVSIEVHR